MKETQNICSSVEQLQSSQESASLSSADDSDADPAYAVENYENFSESSIDSDMECRFSLTEPKASEFMQLSDPQALTTRLCRHEMLNGTVIMLDTLFSVSTLRYAKYVNSLVAKHSQPF